MLSKAKTDPKARASLIVACRSDPKFFFNHFLFTVKNKTLFSGDLPNDIPFLLFEYQE
ncbi:unnamed protein product [marine sediment metagenome]|uniref:Uncharacterized protein n=1 Tax=marine sediment metagenome TaxID=412755 RepID=X0RI97_9ZZZZ